MRPGHRRLLAGALALLVAGCFTKTTEVGPPEHVGGFSIQKFHVVALNDTGNREWDFFEVSHGRPWHTKLSLPPRHWTAFDRVTRLPSASPAWLVQASHAAGVITERNGKPSIELLWRGEPGDEIQQVSAVHWHVPDHVRIEQFPEEIYSGGRLFNATDLTQQPLPHQPPGGRHRLLSISADAMAAAWLRSTCGQEEKCSHSVVASDAIGTSGEPLRLDDGFPAVEPLPKNDTGGTAWHRWFDRAFQWRRGPAGRWEVTARGALHPSATRHLSQAPSRWQADPPGVHSVAPFHEARQNSVSPPDAAVLEG